MNNSVALLGIPLNSLSMPQSPLHKAADHEHNDSVLDAIEQACQAFKEDGRARLMVTVNMDFINKCYGFLPSSATHEEQKKLLAILCGADIAVADGMPLVWLSRLMGHALPQRVTGADLVPLLAKYSSQVHQALSSKSAQLSKPALRLYFLGGGEGIAERAVAHLQERYPHMQVAGIAAPRVDLHDAQANKTITEAINAAHADVLFLALGNPKQEFWFHEYRHMLKVGLTVGVGGSFDFLAGSHRAPEHVQSLGLEWLWRMVHEPKRLIPRYTMNFIKLMSLGFPMILGRVLCFAYASCARCTQSVPFASASFSPHGATMMGCESHSVPSAMEDQSHIIDYVSHAVFTMPPRLHRHDLLSVWPRIKASMSQGERIHFDMSQTHYASMRALGILISLYHQNNRPFILDNCTYALRFLLWSTSTLAPLRHALHFSSDTASP